MMKSLEEIIESRHTTMLEWVEPRMACGPEGNNLSAFLVIRATVHDCINLQRVADKKLGKTTMGDDIKRLEDFVAIHWAKIVD